MTPVLFHFISPTGEPIADTPFDIQLERSDQDEAESGVVLPRLISARTDMEGKATVSLAPTNQRYHVTLVDKDGAAALHHDFYVPVLNNPETVVALEDLIVARDAKLSTVAYDEAALLQILEAKANTLAARDEVVATVEQINIDVETVVSASDAAIEAKFAARNAADSAYAFKNSAEAAANDAANAELLAEDHMVDAQTAMTAADGSAVAAASSAASAAVQAGLANQSAVDAQGSEDTAIAARDAAAISASLAASAKTLSESARDVTVVARDVTLAARDVSTAARDTAVAKAAQLTAQLAAFNEIYIGKFAVAPTVDGNGNALKVGAIYENTVEGKIYQWEADLAWHAYDEESQLQLNNAILSANNAAASAASALSSLNAANAAAYEAEQSAEQAWAHRQAAAVSADTALTAKNAAATSAGEALASKDAAAVSAGTATTKAGEAATSAQAAADYLAQAQAGQVQADWTEGNVANKGFIKNKPVLAPVATSGSKADVGLGNVTNTSDANKPVSTAQQAALDLKVNTADKDASNGFPSLSGFKIALKNAAGNVVSYLTSVATVARTWTFPDKDGTVAMLSDITGTNSGVNTGDETAASIRTKLGATVVTGSNTGDETNATILSKLGIPSISGTNTGDETGAGIKTKLGAAGAAVAGYLLSVDWNTFNNKQNALGFTPVDAATRGVANGVATLDGAGKVPASQLPGYVDDVLEYATYGALPATGTSGVMYVTINDGFIYRWSGSAYVVISASPGSTDAVPEGATNLYYQESRVRNMLLTGLSVVTNAVITAGDTLLGALGKIQKQINDVKSGSQGYISTRDFGNGTLVTTNINYAVSEGCAWLCEITGNSYGQGLPFNVKLQGYIYSGTTINVGGISNGTTITGVVVLNVGGNLCFWWPRQAYWHGFTVFVSDVSTTANQRAFNAVTAITDVVKPAGTKEVAIPVTQAWTQSSLTNLNQLTNGPGFVTAGGAVDGASKVWINTDESSGANSYLTLNRGGGVYAPQYNTAKLYFTPSTGMLYSANGYTTANNGTWGRNLYVGNNPTYGPTTASVAVTDGNIHLDPATTGTHGIYFNFYSGTGGVKFGNGAQGINADISAAGVMNAQGYNGPGTGLTGYAAGFKADKARMVDLSPQYGWAASTPPGSYETGIYCSFVSASEGFQDYGGLINFRPYAPGANGGGNLQLFTPYSNGAGGDTLKYRIGNANTNTHSAWRTIWDTSNLNPQEDPVVSSVVKRTVNGYILGSYVNMTDDGNPGENGAAVTAIITKRGDHYYRSTNATRVKTFLGITGQDVYSVRSNTDSYVGVCREMAWQNYGNSHTIFDASKGISPTGTAVNNTNPDNAWSATYPTLMGWNGANTYGLRVDRARYADGITGGVLGNVGYNGIGYGSYGSVNIAGQTGGYSGFSFSDFNMCQMVNRTYQGFYRDNGTWLWRFDDGVLNIGTVPGGNVTGTVPAAGYLNNPYAFTDGTSGWFRSTGECGWYSSTYGGGIYCIDTTWVRTYNGKGLYSGGDIFAVGNVTAYSDETLKTNWRFPEADFVARWATIMAGTYDRIDIDLTQDGVSAQGVQKILPNSVTEVDGKLTLNYAGATAVATVELAKKVMDQEQQIKDLTALVQSLINHVKELEAK